MAAPAAAENDRLEIDKPNVDSVQIKTSKIDTAEIDRRAMLLMNQLEMTGLSVAIVENGKTSFAKGYGEEIRDSGRMVTADTVFRWASVSKGVAANTLLSLVEEGEFSLSDSAEELAPSLNLPYIELEGEAVNVNLLQILSHQTGIVRNAYDNRIEAGHFAKATRASLKDLDLLCVPGTCHTYQNVAFDAASEVIENQTKLPYKTVVQSRVFDKLGMKSASLTLEGKWMAAQFPANRQIPQGRLEAMQTPVIKTTGEQRFLNRRYGDLQRAHYGLGWRIYDYHGHKVVGHRGGVQGYRALVLFDPEKQAGIAMMWNSPET